MNYLLINSTFDFVMLCLAAFGCGTIGYLIGEHSTVKHYRKINKSNNKIQFISVDDLKEQESKK